MQGKENNSAYTNLVEDLESNKAINADPRYQEQKKIDIFSKKKLIYFCAIANGGLYFFIAAAGGKNLKNLFEMNESSSLMMIYVLGSATTISYGMFFYKTLENLTILPNSKSTWLLASLGPFAACSFLAGGIEGANYLNIPNSYAIPIGIILFMFRNVNMIDGAVKFPGRLQEVQKSLLEAIHEKNYKELARLIITIYTAIGFPLSTTDAIYSVISTFMIWLGASEDSLSVNICSYLGAGIGAVAITPMIFYWAHRGIKQLTFGGTYDQDKKTKDPTDMATLLGAISSIPVILGSLGSATASNAKAFGSFGLFSNIVRITSSVTYAVTGAVPGLSTLYRNLSGCKSTLFNNFNCCRKKPTISERTPLIDDSPTLRS